MGESCFRIKLAIIYCSVKGIHYRKGEKNRKLNFNLPLDTADNKNPHTPFSKRALAYVMIDKPEDIMSLNETNANKKEKIQWK